MLVLDKARALDRMVYLADRKGNTPPEFLRPAPLRWTVASGGHRALAGEVVLFGGSIATGLEGGVERKTPSSRTLALLQSPQHGSDALGMPELSAPDDSNRR